MPRKTKDKPVVPIIGVIEKGVAPSLKKRSTYPFLDMAPGDSFVAQGIARNKVAAAVSSHKKRHGGDWSMEPDDKTGGIRVRFNAYKEA